MTIRSENEQHERWEPLWFEMWMTFKAHTHEEDGHLIWDGPGRKTLRDQNGKIGEWSPQRLSVYLDRGLIAPAAIDRTCDREGCVLASHLKMRGHDEDLQEKFDKYIRPMQNGHVMWEGASKPGRYPHSPRSVEMSITLRKDGRRVGRKYKSARKIAWELHYKVELAKHQNVYVTCGEPMCVNWEHLSLSQTGRQHYLPQRKEKK